jgi:flagellar basal body-associated protein FliL
MLLATYLRTEISRSVVLLVLPVAIALMSGCYDGAAMLKQAHSTALSSSVVEVDLGTYRTTLPRDPNTNTFVELEIHVFGTVSRAHLADVEKQLKTDDYRVRQETLTAVRSSTREELTDPTLTQLRARIEQVLNKVLADAPLKEVGFYQLSLR